MTQPHMQNNVLTRVRQALGHQPGEPLATPTPPTIDEPLTRLVHSEIGLPELFARSAADAKMLVEPVYVEELASRLIEFLHAQQLRKIALADSPLLRTAGLIDALRQESSLTVNTWDQLTLDELYDFDAGVTDVYAAVAETGSLVLRASPAHGRALSLVPAVHVAVVEPKNLVADLVDLFPRLAADGIASAVSIITGPSKTSDIEMNLVVGVHGPVMVKIFMLQ
jgi:L-lactate dehydrogenase complex protein LldG